MKKIKNTIILFLVLALVFISVACNNNQTESTNTEETPDSEQSNTSSNADNYDDYPKYSVSVVCPFGSGGDTDTTARGMAAALSDYFGKTFTVNNMTGGTGTVALSHMYSSKPDGYTLLWYQSDMIYQTLLGRTEKDWKEAFKVVGICCEGTTDTIFVRSDSDFYTMDDIINYAKENPGELNFATEAGGNLHMCILKMEEELGIDVNPVSLGGGGNRVTALLGGEVDMNLGAYGASAQYVESGDFRPIAVLSDTQNELLNEHYGKAIPSIEEACGLPISTYKMFFLLAPYDTPDEIIGKLADGLEQGVKNEKFLTSINSYFYSPTFLRDQEALDWMLKWEAEYAKLAAYYEK